MSGRGCGWETWQGGGEGVLMGDVVVSGVLKQVWDLADQDDDSMLSLREFCTALYFMERFREGRALPSTLPAGIHPDSLQVSVGAVGQGPGGQSAPVWRHVPGDFGFVGGSVSACLICRSGLG